jgi:hypothetical protein
MSHAVAGQMTVEPVVSVKVAVGELASQDFRVVSAELVPEGNGEYWSAQFGNDGQGLSFRARRLGGGGQESWDYEITNASTDLTVSELTFPSTRPLRLSSSWGDETLVWPSLYQGALLTGLTSPEAFEAAARAAAKNNPYLTGRYQGDLCLPFCVQQGGGGAAALRVEDPTHEVFRLNATWAAEGMRYSVQTYPGLRPGDSWAFGRIQVLNLRGADWHTVADLHRTWLCANGFGPRPDRHREVAALVYGRWDRLDPAEILEWAPRVGARDVLLWVVLFGRGDQYYPCYFPNEQTVAMVAMKEALGAMREAGLDAYFYTNGYLLSPLQTKADVEEWHARDPAAYPEYIADGDHGRPFYAACVAAPEWRKLLCDTARLHAEMGAGGMFVDQPGAIHPEVCTATGHGHDRDSWGLWNRAYLELMQEVRAAGDAVHPGFFLEIEGAADLYARDCARSLGAFGPTLSGPAFPALLKYTVPWLMADQGTVSMTTADDESLADIVARTFLHGGSFRIGFPHNFAPSQIHEDGIAALASAVAVRRRLAAVMDAGRFLHGQGLDVSGGEATWFSAGARVVVVVRVTAETGSVRLPPDLCTSPFEVTDLSWRDGTDEPVAVEVDDYGRRVISGLSEGLHLLVVRLH